MATADLILPNLLMRTGCGYVVADRELRITAASETIDRFSTGDNPVAGRMLVQVFPEFSEYVPRLGGLFDEPGQQIRFRITRADHHYIMVSGQFFPDDDDPALLLLFEDITLLVLRTEILGRRVKELESRAQNLEKALFNNASANHAPSLTPDFNLETGLYGLDYIIRRLVEEEGFSRRWKRPLSVVILRLAANHETLPAGALEAVAGLVRSNLRSMDTMGLLDASAFILVLPQTSRDSAQITVNRILERINKERGAQWADFNIRVGVSELLANGEDTALQVFERAKQLADTHS